MIGLKRGTVKLVRHSKKWRRSFKREEKKIKKIFGLDAFEIQHVGSTAIRGLLAKPIIDIALIVSSLQKARRYEKKLKEIGYEIKKNDARKERLFFTKGPEKKRTHYLHDKDAARKYSALKKKLAEKYKNTREIYTAKKEKLIKKILGKAKKSLRALK